VAAMPTDLGRLTILARIGDCPDRAALERLWLSCGKEYREDDKTVQAFKDMAKVLK